jgi:hypothetical protein
MNRLGMNDAPRREIKFWIEFMKGLGWAGVMGLLLCSRAFAEEEEEFDFAYDIPSMIQLNPDFSTYPGSDGVIWLKQLDYGIAPDGGIERKSLWILLGRQGLDARWLTWNIPVPESGEAEILEASIYSPGSGEKTADVTPTDVSQNGVAMCSVVFSDLPDEFILVLFYREVFPKKLSVDDLVWISEPLPLWEEILRVTVPAGHPFYYNSDRDVTPRASNVDDRMLYEWRIINTAADPRSSLLVQPRGYIAFGMREGKEASARSLKNLETTAVPDAPAAVRDPLKKRADAKGVENVLKWIREQAMLTLPDGMARKIPAEAPWTTREKTLLAYHWLKDAKVDVRLFWQLAYRPAENNPACENMVLRPVLALSMPGLKKDVFYCDMEQPPQMGEDSVSLWGRTVYGLTSEMKLEERKIIEPNASENRLISRFDLRLTEDGILTGAIKITARGGWRHFLFSPNPTSDDLAFATRSLFPLVFRYNDLKFKGSARESELSATLAATQLIKGTGGSHMLASVPPLVPDWFKSLSSGPFPCTLNFSFVMDAHFSIALPSSTTNVIFPAPTERNVGKIKYAESYKLNKRKTLTAEAHMTVGTTAIIDDNAADLKAAIGNWQTFMTRYLPVQLKAK